MLRHTARDRRVQKPLQLSLVLLCCAVFSATFIYHTIYGRHGLEVRQSLITRSAELDREIGSLEAVHADYARQVRLLGDRPDRDLVEEIAARDLGFAYPDERVLTP